LNANPEVVPTVSIRALRAAARWFGFPDCSILESRLRTSVAALLIASLALPVAAQTEQSSRPKIGLALSGGGATGFAHIGVLKVLEEMNVPIDYIAGTSMGALIGALYASGMSPEEIEREVAAFDWDDALDDRTSYDKLVYRRKQDIARYPSTIEFGLKDGRLRGASAYSTGQKVSFMLGRYLLPVLDRREFSSFPIPFAAMATDLGTGEAVVLSTGDIAEAVRASMSIPGVLTPVEIDGRFLVDGGMSMNVPVDVVRQMGADIVIAIDIGAPLRSPESLTSSLAVLNQVSTMLTRANMAPQLAAADLVLAPDISSYSTFDFAKSSEIVALGVEEASAASEMLAKYGVDPALALPRPRLSRERELVVDEIRVVGNAVVEEQFVREQMTTLVGQPLDLDRLESDIERLFGYGDFLGISFSIETENERGVLVIRVTEKPWGPTYVRAGLAVAFVPEDVNLDVLVSVSRRWINTRGAEWRTDVALGQRSMIETEFYQPRQFDRPGFLSFSAFYRDDELDLYSGNEVISTFGTQDAAVVAEVGAEFGTKGEARLGVFYRRADGRGETGPEILESFHETYGGLRGSLQIDTLDNPFIPLEGFKFSLDATAPLRGLGAEDDSVTATVDVTGFGKLGKNTFFWGLFLHDTLRGEGSPIDWAFLGGLFNHSGFARGQLYGPAAAVGRLGWYFEIVKLRTVFGRGIYAGATVEAGDAYEELGDVDLGELKYSWTGLVSAHTNYGPVILAISKGTDSDLQYYITVGRTF
jgi:NTE family protein